MKLLAVNVGRPAPLVDDRTGREVLSGIHKRPVDASTVFVDVLNIDGDGQADLVAHGGVDKAVTAIRKTPAGVGAEIGYGSGIPARSAITLAVADRGYVRIGDRWRWG